MSRVCVSLSLGVCVSWCVCVCVCVCVFTHTLVGAVDELSQGIRADLDTSAKGFQGLQRNGFTTALLHRSDALALINDRYIHISLVHIKSDILVPKVRYLSTGKRLTVWHRLE